MSTMTYPTECPDLESSTEAYARRFSGAIGKYFLDVQLGIVRQMLPSSTDQQILDIGGGHGQLTPPLLREGYDVTVLGSDDSCVERLNRSADQDIRFVTGNLLELPFEDDSFDVVLAFRLLPHLRNWPRFIDELCRVARTSVVLDYPDLCSANWFADRMFFLKKKIEHSTRPYRCFSRREVTDAFKKNQFNQFKTSGQFAVPMAFHRLLRMEWISRVVENTARLLGVTHLFGSPVILKATCI